MKELILLWQADSDIQAAFNRYQEYQAGRGELFLRHLDLAFTLLRQNPEMGRVYARPYRRLLIRDFPYAIFYQADTRRIVVAAISDLRQDPQTIRKKLTGLD